MACSIAGALAPFTSAAALPPFMNTNVGCDARHTRPHVLIGLSSRQNMGGCCMGPYSADESSSSRNHPNPKRTRALRGVMQGGGDGSASDEGDS